LDHWKPIIGGFGVEFHLGIYAAIDRHKYRTWLATSS